MMQADIDAGRRNGLSSDDREQPEPAPAVAGAETKIEILERAAAFAQDHGHPT